MKNLTPMRTKLTVRIPEELMARLRDQATWSAHRQSGLTMNEIVLFGIHLALRWYAGKHGRSGEGPGEGPAS